MPGSYNTGVRASGRSDRSNRTPGTAEIRYYKMRYMKDDKAIGLETDVVKVVVDIA